MIQGRIEIGIDHADDETWSGGKWQETKRSCRRRSGPRAGSLLAGAAARAGGGRSLRRRNRVCDGGEGCVRYIRAASRQSATRRRAPETREGAVRREAAAACSRVQRGTWLAQLFVLHCGAACLRAWGGAAVSARSGGVGAAGGCSAGLWCRRVSGAAGRGGASASSASGERGPRARSSFTPSGQHL